MKRVCVAAWLLVLVSVTAVAAETELRANVDYDRIDMNGQITLTVTVSGDQEVGKPKIPVFKGFITQGTGSRQNMVVSGGTISNSTSYTYTLIPRQTGRFIIGPITLDTPGGRLSTQPITVTVTVAAYQQQRKQTTPGRTTRNEEAKPFFVEAAVDQDSVYLGEQLTYTFRYFRNVSVNETNNYSPPQTSGFISVDLPPQRKHTRMIGGETYRVVEVRTAMFSTRTGPLIIGQARLRVVPDVLSNLLGRDPFGMFRGQGRRPLTEGEPRNLATRAFEIQVLPLPQVPAGKTFSGAVGQVRLATQISSDSVGLGDPVTLKWTITGKGRKDLVDAPQVVWPEGVETYPPTTTLATSTRNDVVAETKVFSIALVPRQEGTVTIPAPELTYFNPKNRRYETARGRVIELKVGPPRAGMAMAIPTQTISAAASTIRYIKPPPAEWTAQKAGGSVWLFVMLQFLPPLVVVAGWAWKRRMEAPDIRSRGARLREQKIARKRVSAVTESDGAAAAREISAAFRQYLMARFQLPPGDLLDLTWQDQLRAQGCEDYDLTEIRGVLEWADRARFGGGSNGSMSPHAVLNLMDRLDKCTV
jgi:hypothetical protein